MAEIEEKNEDSMPSKESRRGKNKPILYDMKDILKGIESGELSCKMVMEKYGLTYYKYHRILKETGIKNACRAPRSKGDKSGAPPGPRSTAFKNLLKQSDGGDENTTDIEMFTKDCKEGMKISELMEKYKLSIYQIRELRKKHDLKTR
jgi:hypothetical protein